MKDETIITDLELCEIIKKHDIFQRIGGVEENKKLAVELVTAVETAAGIEAVDDLMSQTAMINDNEGGISYADWVSGNIGYRDDTGF